MRITPLHGGLQRTQSFQTVPEVRVQTPQWALQLHQQIGQGVASQAGSSEFQRQRHPLQELAHPDHVRRVARTELKRGA
jgi:hypothetical protein